MKRVLLVFFMTAFLAVNTASADLIDLGDGMIHDTGLGLMWLDMEHDAMTWSDAMTYVETLGHGGYSDWRLPSISESVQSGFFPDNGELSDLYYSSLGNIGVYQDGAFQEDGGLINIDPFQNLDEDLYWYSDVAPNNTAWAFGMTDGRQSVVDVEEEYLILAVRSTSAVPEPVSVILISAGICGIVPFRKKS